MIVPHNRLREMRTSGRRIVLNRQNQRGAQHRRPHVIIMLTAATPKSGRTAMKTSGHCRRANLVQTTSHLRVPHRRVPLDTVRPGLPWHRRLAQQLLSLCLRINEPRPPRRRPRRLVGRAVMARLVVISHREVVADSEGTLGAGVIMEGEVTLVVEGVVSAEGASTVGGEASEAEVTLVEEATLEAEVIMLAAGEGLQQGVMVRLLDRVVQVVAKATIASP